MEKREFLVRKEEGGILVVVAGIPRILARASIFVFATVVVLGAVMTSFGAAPTEPDSDKREYQQDFDQLGALAREHDLRKYEEYAEKIHARWAGRNKENYAQLVLRFCQPMNSKAFDDKRRYVLARKYALLALKDADLISVESERALTWYVVADQVTPRPEGKEWQRLRREDATVRLHAYKRLVDGIDSAWDAKDLPEMNVAPPIGSALEAGGSPEAIKDPKLRAEYEAAIARNKKKAERHSKQYKYRQTLESLRPNMEKDLIKAYSKAPLDMGELQGLLATYVADPDTRKRIVDAVTNNTRSK